MANYIYSATNITKFENTFFSPTPPDMVRKCEFYLNSCITHMGTITEFCPNIQSYVSSGLTILVRNNLYMYQMDFLLPT